MTKQQILSEVELVFSVTHGPSPGPGWKRLRTLIESLKADIVEDEQCHEHPPEVSARDGGLEMSPPLRAIFADIPFGSELILRKGAPF